MKAVIPAAGLGTRFLPSTKAQPKEMLPVYDTPAIQYVVEEAVDSGIDDILIITGRNKRAIEDHFDKSPELELILRNSGRGKYLKCIDDILDRASIHFIRQKEPRGLGDAIYCAKKYVGSEPFAVLLGDMITAAPTPCTKVLIDLFGQRKSPIIAVEKVGREKISSYGIVKVKSAGSVYLIEDLIEKPKVQKAPSNLAIIGRYVLTHEIFDCIDEVKPGIGGEIQLTDALKLLLRKQKIYAWEFKGKRYDIGNKLDWLKSSVEIALGSKEIGEELREYLREMVCRRERI